MKELRGKISIISQMPMIFSGSLRDNLDPLNKFPDAEIWRVLEELKLKERILSGGIEHVVRKRYGVTAATDPSVFHRLSKLEQILAKENVN